MKKKIVFIYSVILTLHKHWFIIEHLHNMLHVKNDCALFRMCVYYEIVGVKPSSYKYTYVTTVAAFPCYDK